MSPTARTLELLRSEGWTVAVAERRLPGCFRTVDLFGAFDMVAVRQGARGVLGIQTTSAGNHASRVRRLAGLPAVRLWLLAGNRAAVVSWRKARGRWAHRWQQLELQDLAGEAGGTGARDGP